MFNKNNKPRIEYVPFIVMYILIAIPYIFFESTLLFPLVRSTSILAHCAFMVLVAGFLLLSARFGFILVNKGKPDILMVSSSSTAKKILWAFVFISIVSHVILVIVAGIGYISGGFIGAREEFITKGVGIPLRLYLFAFPLLFLLEVNNELIKKILIVLSILITLRAFLLSERLAMLEYLMVLWVYVDVKRLTVLTSTFLKMIVSVGLIFVLIQFARLGLQSEFDANLYEVNDNGYLNTIFLYYGDTTNKMYLALFDGFEIPFKTWTALIDEVLGLRNYREDVGGDFIDMINATDRRFVKALNNLGGVTQDISDWGWLGGLVIIFLKMSLFAYIIAMRRKNLVALALSSMVLIAIVEYPRFNYLYLPFMAVLFILATFVGVYFQAFSRINRNE